MNANTDPPPTRFGAVPSPWRQLTPRENPLLARYLTTEELPAAANINPGEARTAAAIAQSRLTNAWRDCRHGVALGKPARRPTSSV
jgi:hypothetical protein